MFQDDFLMRQVRALVQAVARMLGKRDATGDPEVDAACARMVGLDLDVAAGLPPPALLALLTTGDGLDADRCLALGLGLAVRARVADASGDPTARRLAASARTLIATAIAARPALDSEDLQAVLAALAALAEEDGT